MPDFKLVSEYVPKGDQPEAIDALTEGVLKGRKSQVLLGVTGSGKTFTIANVVAAQQTYAGYFPQQDVGCAARVRVQDVLPHNAVEYFVYYDYYQPGAYVPQSDTYIEKDASINDEIDKASPLCYVCSV